MIMMDTINNAHDILFASSTASGKRNARTCNNIPTHALNPKLELRKSPFIHDFMKAACAKNIFNHVLFSRGVIPCPVDQIINISDKINEDRADSHGVIGAPVIGKKRKRKDTVRERKYEKHGMQIRSVLDSLDIIFNMNSHIMDSTETIQSSECKAVLITVGPSFSSPKEQYLIRFHAWEYEQTNKVGASSDEIPTSMKERLSQEMGRRSVRELICGSLQEEYLEMFERKSVAMESTKVSIACLLSESGAQKLVSSTKLKDSGRVNEHGTITEILNSGVGQTPLMSKIQMPFSINQRLEVREPRMYSKSKGLHRPFVVLDVVPAMKPYECFGDAPRFEQRDRDTWIVLRPFVKAFRI